MSLDYSINPDSTEVIILIYGINGQLIDDGLKSLFTIDLVNSSGTLYRSDGDESELTMVGFTNDGIDFMDIIMVNGDDLGRIANGEDITQPYSFILHPAFPNPFNPNTNIRYEIGSDSKIDISILNLRGQTVTTLVNEVQ